jgi:Reverse transcriptase (RNA-dependent DNA polymerase)
VVHSAVLARQSSTRLVVSMSMTHGWELQSLDISKAYVQGENLQRDIYMVPPKELYLDNRMLKLVKPLYGITDAGDIWYETHIVFLQSHLSMRKLTGDPGVLFRTTCDGPEGLVLMYVDGLLLTGSAKFLSESESISRRFESGVRKRSSFMHTGM